ncbi:MAG TPA: response regulator transcription factor [Symbiobacteriaceae bacterium]|jgi:DNA-binding response OmpR family regulator
MADRKIVVVDDDPTALEVVAGCLQGEGYQVLTYNQGLGACELIAAERPGLLILDVVLPFVDGLEICRKVRAESAIPILMLSARTDEIDKVLGLGMGADDYLCKPFGRRELVARVKAIFRRIDELERRFAVQHAPGEVVRVGGLEIDNSARTLRVDGTAVALPAKEFDLLWFLACHQRQVFSHAQLYERLWGGGYGDVGTVAVHIKRLRDKIEPDPARPSYLKTVRGVGYKLEAN